MSSRATGRRRLQTRSRARQRTHRPGVELMETRQLLATFTVSSNGSAGEDTLRQAILDANASPGLDTITFDLEDGETTITLASEDGPLPDITDPVTIDGSTQPGFVGLPIVEINGSSIDGDGLRITGGDSTIRALAINRFGAAGIRISEGDNNRIEGVHVGLDTDGTADLGNGGDGIVILSSDNLIGGTGTTGRNLISGNGGDGIEIRGGAATGNIIRNNHIGVDRTGRDAIPNEGNGVTVDGGSNNTIGGATSGFRNVISGNDGSGVALLGGGASDNVVTGNLIGAGVESSINTLGNGESGVLIDGGSNNTIGGTSASAGNQIAFNGQTADHAGVLVLDGTGNTIQTNAISRNTGLGIDLGGDGVTFNDEGDEDSGPNERQNFPEIFAASTENSTTTTVQGMLESVADSTFVLQFFEVISPDGTAFGEGRRFVGQTTVNTDDNGEAIFDVTLPATVLPSRYIAATATDLDGNTSEFSQAVQVVQGRQELVDLVVAATDDPDPVQVGAILTYTATLRNQGFDLARGVVFTASLPRTVAIENVAVSGGLEAEVDGNRISVDVGQLNPGGAVALAIDVRPAQQGRIDAFFSARGTATDLDPVDNEALASTQVNLAPEASVLAFRAGAVSVSESGNEATLTVVRSNAFSDPVTVQFATFDGSAVAGEDFEAASGSLTFGPSVREQSFPIPILDNDVFEPNRSFGVRLSAPGGGAVLGFPFQAEVTIFDDDPPQPPPQFLEFAQTDFSVLENEGTAVVTVERTGSTVGTVSVPFSTSPDTAIAGEDFQPVSGVLSFDNGESTASFQVPIEDDDILNGNRSFNVELGTGQGAATGERDTAVVTIIDDESPPAGFFQFEMDEFQVVENQGVATITVTREDGIGEASIPFTATAGTAEAGTRFEPVSGTLEFGATDLSQTFDVALIDTDQFEGPQTVLLSIDPSGLASPGDPTEATLVIQDDETPPADVIQLADSAFTVGEDGGEATITLVRAGNAFGEASVGIATALGSAVDGQDFQGIARVVTFADGQTTQTVSIPVLDNNVIDGNRTVGIFLSDTATGNAVVGPTNSAVLTIVNDDADATPPVITNVDLNANGGVTGATLNFSEPLNPLVAQHPPNYQVVTVGRNGQVGAPVGILAAQVAADLQTVNLVFAGPVPTGTFVRIAVNAALEGGVADLAGNPIDGDGDGLPGGDFVTTLARASNQQILSYIDADGDLVELAVFGGGGLEVTRDASGEGQVARILDAVPFQTILRGRVTRQGGGDGRTTLDRIEGLEPFGRVRSALRTPPFFVGSQPLNPAAIDALLAGGPLQRRRR